jgi:nitrate reductase NapE component
MDDRDLPYEEHERRFRRQVRNFLTIIVVLFAINAVSNWGGWWFQWPALGLGIALAFSMPATTPRRPHRSASPPLFSRRRTTT